MAHSFKTYPGRPAFDVFGGCIDAGDYVRNKKARASFCGASLCNQGRNVSSQGNLLLLNESKYLNYFSCGDIDKTRKDLLEYCKLDTLAMVEILKKLKTV